MTNYSKIAGMQRKTKTHTSKTKPIPGREDEMTQNAAGGYSFKVDDFSRLNRFLILGVTGNTFYQSQKTLVKENAAVVERCLKEDARRVVDMVIDVAKNGRAFKNDPSLFVLAMAASYEVQNADNKEAEVIRAYALSALPVVARYSTSLFQFFNYVKNMRGWGRSLRKAFAKWYTEKPTDRLAMQAWKYKNREGVSHQDIMRLAHPVTDEMAKAEIFRYMARPEKSELTKGVSLNHKALEQIAAAEELLHMTGKSKDTVSRAVKLIWDHRLTHEAVPGELKNSPDVWMALLENMPVIATVRNLGQMTSKGVLDPMSDGQKMVIDRLNDNEQITKSRAHPMQFLLAAKQYGVGRGMRGSLSWSPNNKILNALDDAYYAAFGNVPVTGKRIIVAIDYSGSMTGLWGCGDGVCGISGFTPAQAAAAMALVTLKVEPNAHLIGYATDAKEWNIDTRARIDTIINKIGGGGGTNTAMPVHYVLDKKMDVDGIVSYTDGETWANRYGWGGRDGHVVEMLRDYRNKHNPHTRFVNVAMTATGTSDVDPTMPGMLELTGMDASTPSIISAFLQGDV